jgi:hypothetical protein
MNTKNEKKLKKALVLKEKALQSSEEKRKQSNHKTTTYKHDLSKQTKRLDYTVNSRDKYKSENRALKKANKKLQLEVAAWQQKAVEWQQKAVEMEEKIEDLEDQLKSRGFVGQPIERHKYMDSIVGLCMDICATSHCGLRTTIKILEHFKNRYPGCQIDKIPSHTSIANWSAKCGYYEYTNMQKEDIPDRHALIIDESMMAGSEKLMLVLGVPADKSTDQSLTTGDVKVLHMAVQKSWNSEDIGNMLEEVKEKTGSPPVYVISDNARTISKAVSNKGYVHIRDIGHSIALIIQHAYEKQEDFQSLIKDINEVKSKEIMRDTAYLLSPKIRTIARFMSISLLIKWAVKMLTTFWKMNQEEQSVFGFLLKYRSLIKELEEVFKIVNPILKHLKCEGMSKKSVEWCLSQVQTLLSSTNQRVVSVGQLIEEYINTEYGKLSGICEKWNISSDVIESIFGIYKAKASPDPMNGVTKRIFILPLLTKLNAEQHLENDYFKIYLEGVFLKDINNWGNLHLSENRAVKRRKMFAG